MLTDNVEKRMPREPDHSVLQKWGVTAQLTHTRTLTSSVTTAWGVSWDEVLITRDLMQNFFDANRTCLNEVCVETKGSDVAIKAPTQFNLERLFYFGSEKGDDDVGRSGEGFKVAAACLLRDHAVMPIALSGWDVVCLRIADRAVADTHLYPVEYDFYRSSHDVPGTILLLPGCSAKLARAVADGLSHFFHDGNDLLGRKLWSSPKGEFALYESKDRCGYVFYRKLRRGEIEGIPIILTIDKRYQVIERKISRDRDRNAFGEEVMRLFYSYFARNGLKWADDGQRVIVEAARSCWAKGHPLLSQIANARRHRRPWPARMIGEVFGDRHYARSGRPSRESEQLEIERLERRWQDEGKVGLPAYFAELGLPTALDEVRRIRYQALEEAKKNNRRAPTPAEQDSIRVLSRMLRELAPEMMALFDKGTTNYTVARTEAILGALRSERYHSRDIFLAERVFTADFSEAMATFLHEHAHICGYDGSRSFTDALTELLDIVVRQRKDLDEHESEWEKARERVRRERQEAGDDGRGDGLQEWLAALDESGLRHVLSSVPTSVLRRLRKDRV